MGHRRFNQLSYSSQLSEVAEYWLFMLLFRIPTYKKEKLLYYQYNIPHLSALLEKPIVSRPYSNTKWRGFHFDLSYYFN